MIEKRSLNNHNCPTTLCKAYKATEEKISAEKNGKKYLLINNSGFLISKYNIDDCVFKDIKGTIQGFTMCDYIVVVKNEHNDIYVWIELKGADENHACKQIKNTLENVVLYANNSLHFIRIVTSKALKPGFRSDDNRSLRKRFSKKNQFIVKTNLLEEATDIIVKNI